MIDFNIPTDQRLFNTERLGNHIHYTFIFTFFLVASGYKAIFELANLKNM